MDMTSFQPHDLTTAASGDEQQMGDQPPFQRFRFHRLYDGGDLFRLKIVDLAASCFRKRGAAGSVIADEHFLFSL